MDYGVLVSRINCEALRSESTSLNADLGGEGFGIRRIPHL